MITARLPTSIGGKLVGAPVQVAQLGGLPETQCQLPAHATHADPHWRTAQAAAARLARISAHRHGASGRSGWTQGAVSHQRRRPGDAMGNCGRHPANLRTLAAPGAGSSAGAVSLRDPRFSFRQRQRVHQLQRGASAGQAADRTNQVAGASYRRQRFGGIQERGHHPQAHWLRPHRCETRRRRWTNFTGNT